MKIELINLGRNKVNTTLVVKNEKEMWKIIQSHLLSRDIELTETDTKNKYSVFAGFRQVGEIIINL